VEVTGPVKYIHQYVDMPSQKATITLSNGTEQEVRKLVLSFEFNFSWNLIKRELFCLSI
jgi:neutral ceramidase